MVKLPKSISEAIGIIRANIKTICLCVLVSLVLIVLCCQFPTSIKKIPFPVLVAIPTLAIAYLGVHMAAHPPNEKETMKKRLYKVTFGVLAFLIFGATWAQSYSDDKQKVAMNGSYSNQLYDLQTGRSNDHNEIVTVRKALIANSAPAVSISILTDEQEKLSQKQIELMQKQKIISESPVDLQSLRAERINKEALQDVAKQRAEIQKERDEIQAKEARKQADLKRKNDDDKKRQEALINERRITGQSLAVFNYAINKLHDLISKIASDTGSKIEFDFPDLPTVYDPNVILDGKMIFGTNIIRLGTNSAWEFKIIASPRTVVLISARHGYNYSGEFEHLDIMTASNSVESSLTIQPIAGRIAGLPPYNSSPVPPVDSFAIRLVIANATLIDNQVSFNNFKPGIDEALRSLIESRDAHFPLTIKKNAP